MNDYVIVTTVSTFTHKYVVPKSVIEDRTGSSELILEKAKSLVMHEEVTELSQDWLGQYVVDSRFISFEEISDLMDQNNPYIKGWTAQQKKDYVDAWNEELQRERIAGFDRSYFEDLDDLDPQERYEEFLSRKGREKNV